MVYFVDGVLASGVEIILEMDFVRYAIQDLEIHSFMIQIRILSMILQTFSTILHSLSVSHTRVSYVGTILTMVLIIRHGVPLVYEQEPSYNQNFGDNYYPQNSPSFPQQYLCCENCRGPHESFQCQTMNQNYFEPNPSYNSNYSGFDRPSQYPIDQSPPQEMSIQDMEVRKQQYLEEMRSMINQIQIEDYHNMRIDIHYIRECEISIDMLKDNFNKMSIEIEKITKEKELRQREQAANLCTYTAKPSRRFNSVYYDDEESTIPLNEIISQIPPSIAIILKFDKFIKSSVEDLVPIPSEFEDTTDNDRIDDDDFDPERYVLLLEKLLNDDPSSLLPPKELNFEELKVINSDGFSRCPDFEDSRARVLCPSYTLDLRSLA
ncbi:hypothetical protein Tco_0459408 [Tanacetum coccineum]